MGRKVIRANPMSSEKLNVNVNNKHPPKKRKNSAYMSSAHSSPTTPNISVACIAPVKVAAADAALELSSLSIAICVVALLG